ncbi:MAG: S46 family peptidase [Phycisphaerae bacterium]
MRARFFMWMLVGGILTSVAASPVEADEGMWLLTSPPTKMLRDRYGFELKPEWLEHVQKSCVRVGYGGSASIISADGLVMTNHHVGRGQLQKHSTADRNLIEEGFYARTREEELRCDDLEMNVLWSMEDVTDLINAAAAGKSAAAANDAREAKIAELTKQSQEKTGLFSEVVTLYHGARFHLYGYKRFTDIRLVMAPEAKIAAFGGDTDNFEYPRFCLDMCFFRIYEDGHPWHPEHYLSWSRKGVAEGDLVFVAGHPARTQRLYTTDHLKFLRDVSYPATLRRIWRREVQLLNFSARNDEFARIAKGELLGYQNARKAYTGMLAGLQDPAIFQRKLREEQRLRSVIDANPEYRGKWGDAWNQIAKAKAIHRSFFTRLSLLRGRRAALGGRLFGVARTLVRMGEELQKPNADRLPEFRDSSLDSLRLSLFSPAPIYDDLEINRLASGLSLLAETLGYDDPTVALALAGQAPQQRAEALVRGTRLKDVAVRKRIAEGGTGAVAESGDPMIRLAAALDSETRLLRKRYEDEVESVERQSYAKIAAAKFALGGDSTYPDATFTLRLAAGVVQGYDEGGKRVPPMTTIGGLFERQRARRGEPPFDLPERWILRKNRLDLTVPFNNVSTADIIGGNSGSPLINRNGAVVGLIFDGNLQSLVWNVAFTDTQGRAVSVDARGIIESLRKIYEADALADEILGKR